MRVLMTGGGAPGAPGIIRCLQQDPTIELLTGDARREVSGRYLSGGRFFQLPAADDDRFTERLLDICRREGVDVLMPLVTRELFKFSRHKGEFAAAGTKVLVSDEAALEVANDKGRLYSKLTDALLPVPDFEIVRTRDDFRRAVKRLGYPERRVCFKPCVSNGSRGFRVIDDTVDRQHLLFHHKPDHTFIGFDEVQHYLMMGDFPPLLVSEYLPYDEYSVDCLADRGEARIVIPRLRSRIQAGISTAGTFVLNPAIISYCEQVIKVLGLHGNIGIQVKANADNEFRILEINPRVQGTIVANLGIGVNLPLLAIRQEMGEEITFDPDSIAWGKKFIRYWSEVFYD